MSDVIADLRRDLEQRLNEIERRLADVQPLMDEQEKIRAALARPPSPGRRAPTPRATPARKTSKRAPRGANREAILGVVAGRPGATASEIADVTKISRPVTYNTLAKLVEQGRLAKTALPGGQTGYQPAPPTPAVA